MFLQPDTRPRPASNGVNPTGSFLRFVIGFLTLISVSFVVTFTVNKYATAQESSRQAAAAIQAMLDANSSH